MAASRVENDLIFYVLFRKDMDSLNHAGKMAAQGIHAAHHSVEAINAGEFGQPMVERFAHWQKSTPQKFGTSIVLGSKLKKATGDTALSIYDLRRLVDDCKRLGFAAAVITDPGYPLQDGAVIHGFSCETCAWVFGSKSALQPILEVYQLHPASADGVSVKRKRK